MQILKVRIYHILMLIPVLFLWSCSSVYYMKIEVAWPGKENLPENIQSLTLVNRAVDQRFENIDPDTIQKIYLERGLIIDTVLYDLTTADTIVKVLGDLLFESGRYDIVIPENRFLPHKTNGFFAEAMPWDEVKAICDTFQTDAVLSLDILKTALSTTLDSDVVVYDEELGRYFRVYFATMAIEYTAYIRVYEPVRKQIIHSSFEKDTLLWQEPDLTKVLLSKHITPIKKALGEAGIAIALEYADKISNSWHSQTRKYFSSGSPGLDEAFGYAKNNDWAKAMDIWSQLADSSKPKRIRSKAEYNMALGYEMEGKIDEAIRWGLRSYNTMFHPLTYDYLEILKRRKAELAKYSKK